MDVKDSVCCIDVRHAKGDGAPLVNLDAFCEWLVTDERSTDDGRVAEGDGHGGHGVGHIEGVHAGHVALFNEAIGWKPFTSE